MNTTRKTIAVALTYCTNDYAFLKSCIDHISPCVDEIVVSMCDRMWNGDAENLKLMQKSADENPSAKFVSFEYNPSYGTMQHNMFSRMVAVANVETNPDYIMFLDADEIVETQRFIQWWDSQSSSEMMDGYSLLSYWYFRDFQYRAKDMPDADAIVILKNNPSIINQSIYDIGYDRQSFFIKNPTTKKVRHCPIGETPFVHHYSWVRTKSAMLKKVSSWGHSKDRDWASAIHQEFDAPFRGHDLVFGKQYDTVQPYVTFPLE